MRTDMENLTNALLLIAGEDEYSERATGMQVAESGSSIAHELGRIADAIENSD